ncbi:hypothetical protein P5705_18685 [Pseudomonas entomophila]|uniref:hypothetical protein n=1 Tax=Pseudomonas entomophila TaxID=312306 RepID=UPI002406567E|nr:hypothetical protein [Pseudomonas entomophila]MDF9619678.1 hypothetical protein [Pseudomonas entomophila]
MLEDFEPLKTAEKHLLACCKTGLPSRIGPDRPHVPYPVRTIRASFLRFLILGGDKSLALDERGINLQGAYIEGHLDLRNTVTSIPFELQHCTFENPLRLTEATVTGTIRLLGCRLPEIIANRCIIQSDLHLTNTWLGRGLTAWNASIEGNLLFEKVHSGGSVALPGTQINGVFYCLESSLHAGAEPALILNNVTIGSNVYLSGSKIESIRCQHAMIGGGFRFGATTLLSHTGLALDMVGTQVKHDLQMSDAKVQGQLKLANSQIGAKLTLHGEFDGCGPAAIAAQGATLQGGVSLPHGFSANGAVHFNMAQINDQAVLRGRFEDAKQAIIFDGATIKGNLDLSHAQVFGEVSLITTQIHQQLVCEGTRLHGVDGKALSADAATIGRDAHFSPDFVAKGTVRLLCATFEGDLIFNGARFEGDIAERSLNASQSKVLGKVVLNIQASGSVAFNDACIEGELRCAGSRFATVAKETLSLNRTRIKGSLSLAKLESPLSKASFEHAHAGRLDDDVLTWGEQIVLNGFKYDALVANPPLSLAHRLHWLRSQVAQLAQPNQPEPLDKGRRLKEWFGKYWQRNKKASARRAEDFRPQPWWQLKKVLEDSAHFAEARQVGIELEKERRRLGLIDQPLFPDRRNKGMLSRLVSRGLHWAYGHFTGYGYRPIKLLYYFFGTWVVCASIYWVAAIGGIFAPTDPRIYQNPTYQACRPDGWQAWLQANPQKQVVGMGNWYLCAELPAEYTGLSPLAYSLDVLMPFVDLKQESDWAPLLPTPKADAWEEFRVFEWKHVVRLVIWLQTLIGWGIGLLAAAIISGLARKTE